MTQSLPTPVGLKNEFTTSSLKPNVGDSPTASGNWKLKSKKSGKQRSVFRHD